MTDLRQAALQQAAEMALGALEDMNCGWKYIRESHGDLYGVGWDRAQGKTDDAIEAIRQALNQSPDTTKMIDTGTDRGAWSDVPDATKWVDELRGDDEQEPVGYADKYYLEREGHDFWVSRQKGKHTTPLYTSPPKCEWVDLTDEEIAESVGSPIDEVYLADFRKVIEKLKEKNT